MEAQSAGVRRAQITHLYLDRLTAKAVRKKKKRRDKAPSGRVTQRDKDAAWRVPGERLGARARRFTASGKHAAGHRDRAPCRGGQYLSRPQWCKLAGEQ